jgi:hypothetical protein
MGSDNRGSENVATRRKHQLQEALRLSLGLCSIVLVELFLQWRVGMEPMNREARRRVLASVRTDTGRSSSWPRPPAVPRWCSPSASPRTVATSIMAAPMREKLQPRCYRENFDLKFPPHTGKLYAATLNCY